MKNGMYTRKEFKVEVYAKWNDPSDKFIVITSMDENCSDLPIVLTRDAANNLLEINENYLDGIKEGS